MGVAVNAGSDGECVAQILAFPKSAQIPVDDLNRALSETLRSRRYYRNNEIYPLLVLAGAHEEMDARVRALLNALQSLNPNADQAERVNYYLLPVEELVCLCKRAEEHSKEEGTKDNSYALIAKALHKIIKAKIYPLFVLAGAHEEDDASVRALLNALQSLNPNADQAERVNYYLLPLEELVCLCKRAEEHSKEEGTKDNSNYALIAKVLHKIIRAKRQLIYSPQCRRALSTLAILAKSREQRDEPSAPTSTTSTTSTAT